MAKPAKVIITATTQMARGVGRAIRELVRLDKHVKRVARGFRAIGRGITAMFRGLRRVGIVGIAAFTGLAVAIKKSFDFEAATIQFKVLLGSMAEAKKRFKELQEFSARTPFQLEQLIEASKTVQNFSGGLLENLRTLNLTGDAAAALGKDMQEVTFWYSRFFALTRGGQATGEERRRMLELGLITAEAATQLKNMADAGMGLDPIMAVLNREFRKFKGGMTELSRTGHGLFSTLRDNWTLALATFGEAFADIAKKDIAALIKVLDTLRKDGTIKDWADKAARALRVVRDLISDISKGGPEMEQAFRDIGNVIRAAFGDAARAAAGHLASAAPAIGRLIASGVRSALGLGSKKETMEAIRRAEARGLIPNQKFAGAMIGGKPIGLNESEEKIVRGIIAEMRKEKNLGIVQGMFSGMDGKTLPEVLAGIAGRRAPKSPRWIRAPKAEETALDAIARRRNSFLEKHRSASVLFGPSVHRIGAGAPPGVHRIGSGAPGDVRRLGTSLAEHEAAKGLRSERKGRMGERNNPMHVAVTDGGTQ